MGKKFVIPHEIVWSANTISILPQWEMLAGEIQHCVGNTANPLFVIQDCQASVTNFLFKSLGT